VPSAGDEFSVVSSEKDAKALGEHRAEAIRHGQITTRKRVSLEDLFAEQQEEEVVTLNLVVKGDVQGSVEALRSSFTSLEIPGADIKVLHSGVGGVTESDVTLASAYGAIVIGFNVRPDSKARVSAEKAGVEIRGYKVIYEALDEVKLAAQGLLAPEFKEQHQASVEIRVIFTVPKLGAVAGCMVIDGKVVRGHEARLVRDGVVVWEGKLSSLRRFKDDVREVEKGYECGIGLENFHDIKEGDTLETYSLVEVARAL
jgi:translation initiation factor IF-2